MAKRIEALVEPEMLVWARKSAGFDIQTAAEKAQVKAERLEAWEQGESRPTIPQLRKLGKAYKRPLAVFYLPEPPDEFQAMRDFRRLPGQVAGLESPDLSFQIRRAQSRRELGLELYQLMESPLQDFRFSASLSDDPERVGSEIRRLLRVSYEDQTKWEPGYDTFNKWRATMERAGCNGPLKVDTGHHE